MKVVDIHPEELIDKLNAGSLTGAERARLSAHLAQCAACRFEIAVCDDLEQDAPLHAVRPQLRFGAGPEAPRPAEPRVTPSIRARSRRRWPLVAIAAAFVLCAGGATAAVVSGAVAAPRWLLWVPEASPRGTVVSSSGAKSGKPKAVPARTLVAVPDAPAALETTVSQPVPSASIEVVVVKAAPELAAAPAAGARRAPTSATTAALALATPASAGAARNESSTPRVEPAAALFADANRARRDGNVERAIVLYRSLQSRFPSSAESELSRALVAQLLLDRGSPEAALAGFDRYLAEGAPVLGAEAWVGRARALEQLGQRAQAITAWRAVKKSFPGSVHARLAAIRIAALGER